MPAPTIPRNQRPRFEYRTTFAQVPVGFPNHATIAADLSKISPKPPKGEDWRLVTSSSAPGDITANPPVPVTLFYYWERPAAGFDFDGSGQG